MGVLKCGEMECFPDWSTTVFGRGPFISKVHCFLNCYTTSKLKMNSYEVWCFFRSFTDSQRQFNINSIFEAMGLKSNKGWRDLKEHWRSDLIAAISVALVALPLALGIAVSAGAPPISGLIASIIGGLVTTFFRGSHISINGPTAGLIVVILGAIAALDDGSDRVLNYVFAAILVAGAIQVAMGLLKLGRLANMFHSTVIQGILAAIGVIIFSRQIHVAMGSSEESENVFVNLVHVFTRLPELNPFVTLISVIGLLVLIFHSKIRLKIFQLLPAPMWVLILSIPLVYAFNFFEPHTIDLAGKGFEVGPHLLISIPDHILDAIMFPDFSRIDSFAFWSSSFLIAAIASIESLASAKAVDKLDPLRRKTDLNKDLIGVGIGTMLCGAIGGLPIINVIVRSTVNIHNEAKTKWSNFFHGALLLVFVFLLSPYIQQIPPGPGHYPGFYWVQARISQGLQKVLQPGMAAAGVLCRYAAYYPAVWIDVWNHRWAGVGAVITNGLFRIVVSQFLPGDDFFWNRVDQRQCWSIQIEGEGSG